MTLFQRVQEASLRLTGSKYGISNVTGVKLPTFKGYFNEKRQSNLWPLLPKILKAFPHLSRQWLYFNEGPMLIGHGVPLDRPVPLPMIAAAVAEMAEQAGGVEADIYRHICGISILGGAQPVPGEMAANTANDAKLKELNEKLHKAHEEIIALQSELLAMHKQNPTTFAQKNEGGSTGDNIPHSVVGENTVAHSSPGGNK